MKNTFLKHLQRDRVILSKWQLQKYLPELIILKYTQDQNQQESQRAAMTLSIENSQATCADNELHWANSKHQAAAYTSLLLSPAGSRTTVSQTWAENKKEEKKRFILRGDTQKHPRHSQLLLWFLFKWCLTPQHTQVEPQCQIAITNHVQWERSLWPLKQPPVITYVNIALQCLSNLKKNGCVHVCVQQGGLFA